MQKIILLVQEENKHISKQTGERNVMGLKLLENLIYTQTNKLDK